jgi:hypothetical protein
MDTLNEMALRLRDQFKEGKISRDEYVSGMDSIIAQQRALSSEMSSFSNTLYPRWLNAAVTYYEEVANSIKDLTNTVWQGIKKIFSEKPPTISTGNYNTSTPAVIGGTSGVGSYGTSTSPFPSLLGGNWSTGILRPYAEGGIVPGSPSTPVPILAHGQETVLPSGVKPITVNINNPSVRSDADIVRLAEMVKDVLSKEQRYRHLT